VLASVICSKQYKLCILVCLVCVCVCVCVSVMKIIKKIRAMYVERLKDSRNTIYAVFVAGPKRKKPFGRPRYR